MPNAVGTRGDVDSTAESGGRAAARIPFGMTMNDPVPAALTSALHAALSAFRAACSDDDLAGLALCTDDGLSTLFVVAVSSADLRTSDDPDLLYCPMEWSREPASADFIEVGVELRRRNGLAPDLRMHVDTSFAQLVDALAGLRTEGRVAPEVFLLALSTDPDDHLEALADRAIRRLNPPLVAGWDAFLAKWTGETAG